MASTELLASKIVVLEEEPQIPSIPTLPSAVLLLEGVCERGPINDPTLVTSFEEFVSIFGGFTTDADAAVAAYGFFYNGGQQCWVNRIVHYTDLTDVDAHAAVKATKELLNDGAASAASVGPGSLSEPFALDPGQHIDIDVGSGPVVCTFDAAAATLTDTATYAISALSGGETMGITIAGANGGAEQTVTAAGGETTAVEIANLFNTQCTGVQAEVSGGQVKLTTDRKGTGASIQVTTGGTLNAVLGFPTSASAGTGDVANIDAVTAAEAEAVIEADMTSAVAVTVNSSGQLTIATVATGASAEIQVEATSTVTFGLDTDAHTGADNTPVATLTFTGKYFGAYANDIKFTVEAASNGDSDDFNLKILVSDVVKEVFPNLSMTSTAAQYVETIINDENFGSKLVTVADEELASNQRPANGTSTVMTGGDNGLTSLADADYIGNQAGGTGFYAFDVVTGGRILICPNVVSANVHTAMMDYAESRRNGSMFAILDPPASYTAAQIKAFVVSNGLLEYSEFGAIYWPRIKIVNPSSAVFGTDDTIAVAPSGFIAGKYASNDQNLGGVYESPAGIGNSYGIIRGVVGVEADPDGRTTHQVTDETKRDLIYPSRINPITQLDGTPWHIDGGRTLKSTGNFPNIGERRGAIHIAQSLKAGLLVMKHRFNNAENRKKANRIATAFLLQEMAKGAFRSTDPETAFFVDTSDALNPPVNQFAGIFTMRVGIATNKPNEYILILLTQDTRAFTESLEVA